MKSCQVGARLDINRCPAAGVDSEVDQETSSADVFASVSCGIVTLRWQRFLHFRGSDGGNNVRKTVVSAGETIVYTSSGVAAVFIFSLIGTTLQRD